MRQNNQNKRMRGRSRKASNPLSRTFESNGPDVKIRGTALHVAEKYVQLARDTQASGDRITAENYLQHAEHYFRIIAAAQGSPAVPSREDDRSGEPSSGNGASNNANSAEREQNQSPVMAADAPQPYVDAMPMADGKGGGTARRKPDSSGADQASGKRSKANGEDKSEDALVAQAEGAPAADGVSGAEDEDGASKPKRRARGSRGRGGRKTTASEDGADQQEVSSAPAEDAPVSDAPAAVAEEAAEAPKKPARRTRKAAPKKDAAAEPEAPSQEAVASEA